MKLCKGPCGRTLDRSQFYRHSMMADGTLSYCKECVKGRIRLHRLNNDSVREREREKYRNSPAKKAAIARYKQRHPERVRLVRSVGQIARSAVRKGLIQRLTACQDCGQEGYVEGAHLDYSKPLEVRWLCRRCHRRWDAAHPKTISSSMVAAST